MASFVEHSVAGVASSAVFVWYLRATMTVCASGTGARTHSINLFPLSLPGRSLFILSDDIMTIKKISVLVHFPSRGSPV